MIPCVIEESTSQGSASPKNFTNPIESSQEKKLETEGKYKKKSILFKRKRDSTELVNADEDENDKWSEMKRIKLGF